MRKKKSRFRITDIVTSTVQISPVVPEGTYGQIVDIYEKNFRLQGGIPLRQWVAEVEFYDQESGDTISFEVVTKDQIAFLSHIEQIKE